MYVATYICMRAHKHYKPIDPIPLMIPVIVDFAFLLPFSDL